MVWSLLLVFVLLLWSGLVQFDSAHGTAIVIFDPVFDASSVEGVPTWQLAAQLSVFALFKADVAIRVFVCVLLRKVLDEV